MCTGNLDPCTACAANKGRLCSNCHKVSYCSADCQRSDWPRHRSSCYPVQSQPVGEAGRGLIATRKIKMGELILRESASICLPPDIGIWEAGERIYRQVEKLNMTDQEQFYKLTRKLGLLEVSENLLKSAGEDITKRDMATAVSRRIQETAIFFNNNIETEDGAKCLFLKLSLTNHSCCPNSSWTGGSKNPRQLELRSAKDINEGDEVTVNYIIVEARYLDKAERQARLLDAWGFYCLCELCRCSPSLLETQDKEEKLKAEIRKIQQDMVQECDRNPAFVDWKLLCSLQREILELVSQLVSSQLLLYREYNSLVHLAQLARDRGQLTQALEEWESRLRKLNVERAWKDYKSCLDKLGASKGWLDRGDPPTDQEIRQFLWLM